MVTGWDDSHLHEFELVTKSEMPTKLAEAASRLPWDTPDTFFDERRLLPARAIEQGFADNAEGESKMSIGELCPKVDEVLTWPSP